MKTNKELKQDKINDGFEMAAKWAIFDISKEEFPSRERIKELFLDHVNTWVQQGKLDEVYDRIIHENKIKSLSIKQSDLKEIVKEELEKILFQTEKGSCK